VKAKSNLFNEYDDIDFKICFRLLKSIVKKLLKQVSVRMFSLSPCHRKYNPPVLWCCWLGGMGRRQDG